VCPVNVVDLLLPSILRFCSFARPFPPQGLSHGYGGRLLFKDVDLEIGQGERIAIIGPNGWVVRDIKCSMQGVQCWAALQQPV
jgi:hypothetical protein